MGVGGGAGFQARGRRRGRVRDPQAGSGGGSAGAMSGRPRAGLQCRRRPGHYFRWPRRAWGRSACAGGGAARVGAALGDHRAGVKRPSRCACRERRPASVSPRAHQPGGSLPACSRGPSAWAPRCTHLACSIPRGRDPQTGTSGGVGGHLGRGGCCWNRGWGLEAGRAVGAPAVHRSAPRHDTLSSLKCPDCGGGRVLLSGLAARSDLRLRHHLGRGLAVQELHPTVLLSPRA